MVGEPKRHRDADCARLRALRPADAAPLQLVFPHMVPEVETVQRDLAPAEIAFVDESGRRVDLHALREILGTALVLNGEHPRVVMEAMRHSDLKLKHCSPKRSQMIFATGQNQSFGVAPCRRGFPTQKAPCAGFSRPMALPVALGKVVDPIRIELTTSAMPLRRSSN